MAGASENAGKKVELVQKLGAGTASPPQGPGWWRGATGCSSAPWGRGWRLPGREGLVAQALVQPRCQQLALERGNCNSCVLPSISEVINAEAESAAFLGAARFVEE